MKKKILLGFGAIVVLALSVPAYNAVTSALRQQQRESDCKALQPNVDALFYVLEPFYRAALKQTETPALALLTAAKVESLLPTLTMIHPKSEGLNQANKRRIARMKLFVGDARAWAASRESMGFLHFVSQRMQMDNRPKESLPFLIGSEGYITMLFYCNYGIGE